MIFKYMKNITKSKLTEKILGYLETHLEGVSEAKRREIAYGLTDIAYEEVLEGSKGMADMYQTCLIDSEAHRKQFRDHIELIQAYSKQLFAELRRGGYVKDEIDPKTRKKVLIARTRVLESVVIFLNALNETVNDFYEKVYKIELDDSKGVQTTLF